MCCSLPWFNLNGTWIISLQVGTGRSKAQAGTVLNRCGRHLSCRSLGSSFSDGPILFQKRQQSPDFEYDVTTGKPTRPSIGRVKKLFEGPERVNLGSFGEAFLNGPSVKAINQSHLVKIKAWPRFPIILPPWESGAAKCEMIPVSVPVTPIVPPPNAQN